MWISFNTILLHQKKVYNIYKWKYNAPTVLFLYLFGLALMIGNILRLFKEMLPKLNEAIKLDIMESISKEIDADLQKIKIIDGHFLDGTDGYVDYYSHHAEVQLQNQKKYLEKYLHITLIMQATLLSINKYRKLEHLLIDDHVLLASIKENQLMLLRKDINCLIHSINPYTLLDHKDVKSFFDKIHQNDADRNELKTKISLISRSTGRKKSLLERRKMELHVNITVFEENMCDIDGFAIVDKRKIDLQKRLLLHVQLTKTIPLGMMDVKKALYILQNRKLIEKKIKIKNEQMELFGINVIDLENIKHELVELRKEYLSFKFSNFVEEDENLISMLIEIRNLMASSIKDYQAIAVSGGEYNSLLHKTTAFYWENLSLYRQTLAAVNKLFQEATGLTIHGKFLAECIQQAYAQIPEERLINLALEQVAKVDVSLSQRETVYSRTIAGGSPLNFYKDMSAVFNVRTAAGVAKPFFYIPYNPNLYVLDHPAHMDLANTLGNCFGESLMFLQRINGESPAITNICPERDLINFQLDQSRKIFGCKKISRIDIVEKTRDRGHLLWDDIKTILIKAPESKHGDLCLCRFDGGSIVGHDAEVKHVLGLIKLNSDDSPYKYVVYDYNFGVFGCSSAAQLKIYFEMVLEYYSKFYIFKLDKYADVSESCKRFISNIKPVDEPNPLTPCERHYWSQQRLVLLAKYGNISSLRGVNFVFDIIKAMPPSREKAEIDHALLGNKDFPHLREVFSGAGDVRLAVSNSRESFFCKHEKPRSLIPVEAALTLGIKI